MVLSLLQKEVENKSVELVNDVRDIPGVYADSSRLQQILLNLVGNAVKFTQEGEIVVSASLEGESMVRVNIRDSGIGIDKKNHEKIFESFEQAEGTTERNFGGTGLGLSVTKNLVNLHGGEIGVESALGKGSVFHFTLPVSKGQEDSVIVEPEVSQVFANEEVAEEPAEPEPEVKEETSEEFQPTTEETSAETEATEEAAESPAEAEPTEEAAEQSSAETPSASESKIRGTAEETSDGEDEVEPKE